MQRALKIFIKCSRCGYHTSFPAIPIAKVDLAMFRGSENPTKCKNCETNLDTLAAFCGKQVGSEIVRLEDPIR